MPSIGNKNQKCRDYLMAQKIVEVMLEKDAREQERQQLQQGAESKTKMKIRCEELADKPFLHTVLFLCLSKKDR